MKNVDSLFLPKSFMSPFIFVGKSYKLSSLCHSWSHRLYVFETILKQLFDRLTCIVFRSVIIWCYFDSLVLQSLEIIVFYASIIGGDEFLCISICIYCDIVRWFLLKIKTRNFRIILICQTTSWLSKLQGIVHIFIYCSALIQVIDFCCFIYSIWN